MIRLKDQEIYKYDKKNNKFELFDPFKFKFKGYTIEHLYELNEQRKKIIKELEEIKKVLSEHYLVKKGEPHYIELDGEIELINELNVVPYRELEGKLHYYEIRNGKIKIKESLEVI